MAQIKLEGMSFFAHHGYYTHEKTRGNHFLVDVSLDLDFEQAAIDDELNETVNYEALYEICAIIMDQPCNLIETVAYRIAHEMKKRFPDARNFEVTLKKLSPELGGPVKNATVIYRL